MRVVLASRNAGKLRELRELLAPLDIEVTSQEEFDIPATPETGLTFVENALLKARAVAAATTCAALADDSGIVVPALGGAPGIYSARYAGTDGDDAANNRKLIAELQQLNASGTASATLPGTLAPAYFFCAIVFLQHATDPTPLIATARWHGHIVAEAAGTNGFGYDPHFYVEARGCTSAELEPTVKNQLSHRAQATRALLAALQV